MGIKNFNTWFGKTFPQAYVPVKRHCDHLYLDMASFLHEELRKAQNHDNFHHLLHARLDRVLSLCEPRKTVVFALDGPAPLAKLITQRERRRREQQRQERIGLKVLSSLGLTPGTSLMALIQQSLAFYICRRLDSPKWQNIQWELSGTNVQGEGEVKILSRVLRPWAEVTPQDEHVIVALDSDMVLMTLMMPNPNVYVLSEPTRPPRSPVRGKAVRLGRTNRPMFRGYACFSPPALHQHWYRQHPFLRGTDPEETGVRMAALKRDLALLAILGAGNDYVPTLGETHSASFGLWAHYIKLKGPSSTWASRSLTRLEGRVAVLDRPVLADFLRAVVGKGQPQGARREAGKPPADTKLYIEGLEWNLRMYTEGSCPDYRWSYGVCAPSAHQLIAELSAEKAPAEVVREGGAMLPTVCAMALLPAGKVGEAYAPSALRHLMTDGDSPIADLYQSCSTCDDLRLRDSRATIALVKARELMYNADKVLAKTKERAARAHDSDLDALVAKSDAEATTVVYEQAKASVQKALEELREVSDRRTRHVQENHPYASFPIERLEAAVQAVPLESFPVVERELAVFGAPQRFWREQGSAQEEFSNGAASVFTFPDAPSSAMSAISKHALIRRENLPEHMPLLHIPPLADVPENRKEASPVAATETDSAQASAAASAAAHDSGATAEASGRTATAMRQSLKQLLRIKAGAAQRHAGSSKKKGRHSIRRLHGSSASSKPSPGARLQDSEMSPASSNSRSDLPDAQNALHSASRLAELEQMRGPSQDSSGPAHADNEGRGDKSLIRPSRGDQRLIRPSKLSASSTGTDGDAVSKLGSSSSTAAELLPAPRRPLGSSSVVTDSGSAGSNFNITAVQAQPLAAAPQPRRALLSGASAGAHARSAQGFQSSTLRARSRSASQTSRRRGMPVMSMHMRQVQLRGVGMQLRQRSSLQLPCIC